MINFFSNQELRIILNSYVLDYKQNSAWSFLEDNTDNRNNRDNGRKLWNWWAPQIIGNVRKLWNWWAPQIIGNVRIMTTPCRIFTKINTDICLIWIICEISEICVPPSVRIFIHNVWRPVVYWSYWQDTHHREKKYFGFSPVRSIYLFSSNSFMSSMHFFFFSRVLL